MNGNVYFVMHSKLRAWFKIKGFTIICLNLRFINWPCNHGQSISLNIDARRSFNVEYRSSQFTLFPINLRTAPFSWSCKIFYRSLLISLYDSHAGEHSDVGFCRYDRLHPVCTRRPWRHGGKTASDHVVEQSQTRNPHLYHLLVNLTRFSHL